MRPMGEAWAGKCHRGHICKCVIYVWLIVTNIHIVTDADMIYQHKDTKHILGIPSGTECHKNQT